MDPTNHLVLLCASERVYRSEDNGITYAPISGDLSTNPVSELVYGTVTTLDVSPLDPMIYFAGTDDGRVWRTTNRGASWTEITAGLPLRWVTRVVADPLDVHGVYVTPRGSGWTRGSPTSIEAATSAIPGRRSPATSRTLPPTTWCPIPRTR